MDELESIKLRKLAELQQQSMQHSVAEEQQLQQQIEQLDAIVKQKLTKDALQRYGNIKVAHPEKALQLIAVLGQLLQSNRIDMIDDAMLKNILIRLTPEKKGFTINRK